MSVNILAVGDVVGENALSFLSRRLWSLRRELGADFTVVNGENASVVGINPHEAGEIFSAGADVVTLGNHALQKYTIFAKLDDDPALLRPANLSPLAPGRGWGVYQTRFGDVAVINLIGRCGMDFGPDNPFYEAERILEKITAKIVLIDFHAEATSEKAALAWHLDGRVTAVWGTHTHVQTSDAGVLPRGTGFITDLGMAGPIWSILGVKPEQSVSRFLGEPRRTPYVQAPGPCKIEGAVFTVDEKTGKCISVSSVRVTENEFSLSKKP